MAKLKDYLLNKDNDCIILNLKTKKWQDAVKAGCDILVRNGGVQERYYQAILDNYEENGAYFVICPGIAMPHSRPENGVVENCFSLITLKKPIKFNSDNDPVKLIFTFGAIDAASMNNDIIPQLVDLFDNEEAINILNNAKSYEDVEKALDLID